MDHSILATPNDLKHEIDKTDRQKRLFRHILRLKGVPQAQSRRDVEDRVNEILTRCT